MRRLLPILLIMLGALLLAACSGTQSEQPASQPPAAVEVAQAATATPPPTETATPTVTSTSPATTTPAPTATPSATPTATPTLLPKLVQMTTGGCCVQPFWSGDAARVQFIDKPNGAASVGIYGVTVAQPEAAPVLVSERIEDSLAVGQYRVETTERTTTIVRLADGERWAVPAAGRNVVFSADQARIAWTVSDDDLPPDQQVTAVWVANVDGSDAKQVATLRRGGLSGWIGDSALLVNGRESADARDQVLWALALTDGSLRELARAERLRSPLLSPSGRWVVYYTTFDADPARNGLWLAGTDAGAGAPVLLPRELFGSYQWRACAGCDETLLVIPFRPEATFHELWEVEPATLDARPLTDPAVTPFKIANGDWRVSPDGRYMAFVESADRNVWVLNLPGR